MKAISVIKSEKAEIAVEASVIFPIILMVIYFLIQIGFLMYQKTLLTVVANDTAASIAQVYSTTSKDPFVGYTDTKELMQTSLYRNLYNLVQSDSSMDSKNQEKASWYARYRLIKNRLYRESGEIIINVAYERQEGTLLQKTVVVTIMAKYDMPMARFFGILDSSVQFIAEGRAECLDLLDYSSTLVFADTVAGDVLDPVTGQIVKTKNDITEICDQITIFLRS